MAGTPGAAAGTTDWLTMLRCYLVAIATANLVWEVAQMPLYTLWWTGTPGEIASAILHCTAGDVLIAAASLVAALVLLGASDWPQRRFGPVAAAAVAIGLGYTAYSERVNLARSAWAYSDLMPTLPWLGTGLAPVAQWLLIPTVSLVWACRHRVASVDGMDASIPASCGVM
ncbi:hypothetical protein [Siccirubricoccus sp. G192]|uniref:hypothetical protein n=1 Tax=Siccirubricoccus sp. G192 TaxID=2849651 RepID=UPI001C2B94DE|nr:hypothetical protein [Siccirubricoccus sp. G192]MBV1796579.1 hypothetical protein [Siccirubricoccus sp. G192]